MNPYLIQRGTFKKIADSEITGFDSLVQLDYMGSVEFEFGTIPGSLKQICADWKNYRLSRVESIQDLDGGILYILAPLSFLVSGYPKDETVTHLELKKIATNLFTQKHPYRMKEYSYCYERIHGDTFTGRIPEINFWWDVEHHWMMCFGEDIKRLVMAIQKVCVKKELSFEGGPTVGDELFKMPVFKMDTGKNAITVTDFNGHNTIISLGKVQSVSEDPDKVTVVVHTRSGEVKPLYVRVLPSTKREYLVGLLGERANMNARKKEREANHAK